MSQYGMKEPQVPKQIFDKIRCPEAANDGNCINYEKPGYSPLTLERFERLKQLVVKAVLNQMPAVNDSTMEFVDGYDQWCEVASPLSPCAFALCAFWI